MALHNAHEGYEYQDLLTAHFVLKEMTADNKSSFSIDRKAYTGDIIDDLTITNQNGTFKKQVKYSNQTVDHVLEKADLANDSNYNLALYSLFRAWRQDPSKDSTEFRICLAWKPPTDNLLDILIEMQGKGSFDRFPTTVYRIDGKKLWPDGQPPLTPWRKFREESAKIDRDEFMDFCSKLLIEVGFPKFSLDLNTPGTLESIVQQQAKDLGLGIYPNGHMGIDTFILSLIAIIKRSRSKGTTVSTASVFHELKIVTDFGSIHQEFPLLETENIKRSSTLSDFLKQVNTFDKVLLLGEPGAGKSWFIENLDRELKKKKINVVKHFCYVGLDDPLQRERIQMNIFYGNLISEIIKVYPKLREVKRQKYASSLGELNLLLQHIDEPTFLIVDGLDHIERIASFRNYTDIARQDIAIIESLAALHTSPLVKILVSSQNVEELDTISGFNRTQLPKWNHTDVKRYLQKIRVENAALDDGTKLSSYLLQKSSGNALYLKYLIGEVQRSGTSKIAALNLLPAYDFNLSTYYSYLLSQLNTREEVPQVLSGVEFSLSRTELQEITGAGDQVQESLNILSPALSLNISQSGYRIYHESFRRFILEHLESRSISIEKKIFSPIREWFASKDFYTHRKSFRYYLKFLYDENHHKGVIAVLDHEFVTKSILNGYSWELIEQNYRLMVGSACATRDFVSVVLLNEIDKVISHCKQEFPELTESYLEAIGRVEGFEKVADFLVFEGEPALDYQAGLKACYLCDDHQTVAPWETYMEYFIPGNPIPVEELKYYLRGLLVLRREKALKRVAIRISRAKDSKYAEIFRDEMHRCANQEYVLQLRTSYPVIDRLLSPKQQTAVITAAELLDLADQLLDFDNVFDEETLQIKRFLGGLQQHGNDTALADELARRFSSINWFYNWLIYAVRTSQISPGETDHAKVKLAFDHLGYRTGPFEGKPRTCDLYSLRDTIYQTLDRGLKLLTTEEQWKQAIDTLVRVSDQTTTYLQRSVNGPIATESLLALLSANQNAQNRELIFATMEEVAQEKEEYHLHSDVAQYQLRLASIASHADNQQARAYLEKGVRYALAYTMRKDITLMDAIQGVAHYAKLDRSRAKADLRKVRMMVDSAVYHTDGRETAYFPVSWFISFLEIDRKGAMAYLLGKLAASRYDWTAERSLVDLLGSLGGTLDPQTEAYLCMTLPIADSERFIDYQLNLYTKLKTAVPQLAQTLLARIADNIAPKKDRRRSDQVIKKYNDHVPPGQHIPLSPERRQPEPVPLPRYLQIQQVPPQLSLKDKAQLADYFSANGIEPVHLQMLTYVLDGIKVLDQDTKALIDTIITKTSRNYAHRELLDEVFGTKNQLECYYWTCRFLSDSGDWFERLTNKQAFLNAHKIDPELAMQLLFEVLPPHLDIGFNSHFSANLIDLLIQIGHDRTTIEKMWDTLLQMTSYRLPSQEEIPWDTPEGQEEMGEGELLDCILLTRFRAGTTERFRWTAGAIQNLMGQRPQRLIRPFHWFLSNRESFEKSSELVILQAIYTLTALDNNYPEQFRDALMEGYPSGHFLRDYLISEIYGLPFNPVTTSKKGLIYPKIDPAEYDHYYHLNAKFRIYENIGINIEHCLNKFSATFRNKYNGHIELYLNRSYKRIVPNVHAAEHMLELLNTDCYEEFANWSEVEPTETFRYATFIDTESMAARINAQGARPTDLPKPHQLTGPPARAAVPRTTEDQWLRIAHYETELKIERVFDTRSLISYGGISFSNNTQITRIPYAGYAIQPFQFWWTRGITIPVEEEIIFFASKDDQIEFTKLLWPHPSIVKALGLTTTITNEGLVAKNSAQETIIKTRTWCTDYIGDALRTTLSDEIPTFQGIELLIREDYFEKLKTGFTTGPNYISLALERSFP